MLSQWSFILELSPILRGMESEGKIQIVGCTYNLETGRVQFLSAKNFRLLRRRAQSSATSPGRVRARIYAHVIHFHALGERGGGVRVSRPTAPDGDIED